MNEEARCPRCRRAVPLLRTRRGVVLDVHDVRPFSDDRAARSQCPGSGRKPDG